MFSPYEQAIVPVLESRVRELNAQFGAPVVTANLYALPVVDPAAVKQLGVDKRGWYFAEQVYSALHGSKPPEKQMAIRLGWQLKAMCAYTKRRGTKNAYWLAPVGVRPPEQIGVL